VRARTLHASQHSQPSARARIAVGFGLRGPDCAARIARATVIVRAAAIIRVTACHGPHYPDGPIQWLRVRRRMRPLTQPVPRAAASARRTAWPVRGPAAGPLRHVSTGHRYPNLALAFDVLSGECMQVGGAGRGTASSPRGGRCPCAALCSKGLAARVGDGVVTAWWALPVRCALFEGFGVARRESTPAMRRRRSRRSWTRRNIKTSNTHAAAGGIVRAPRCLAVRPGFFLEGELRKLSDSVRTRAHSTDTDLHLPRIALHGRRCAGCAGWPDRKDASSERPEAAVTRRLEGRGSSDQRAGSAHVCMTTRACASHFEDLEPYIPPSSLERCFSTARPSFSSSSRNKRLPRWLRALYQSTQCHRPIERSPALPQCVCSICRTLYRRGGLSRLLPSLG
jgi:hypothetical protein